MKTYAPSLTKSCAVANPMPSVPPVITATFPSNLPTAFLLLMSALLPRRSAPLPPRTFVSKPNFPRTELDGSQPRRVRKSRITEKEVAEALPHHRCASARCAEQPIAHVD